MRIISLEHAPCEGPGRIADWAQLRGHQLSRIALYDGEQPLDLSAFDLLVIMGGAMNIYEHCNHPWLVAEKKFIARVIESGKPVLGICLGAQLLADVFGAKVCQNPVKEIGWFPVNVFDRTGPFAGFAEKLTVMHWHGDTFEIPPGARRVAESEGCANQAFVFGERVVGLQFHIELGKPDVAELTAGSLSELEPAPFIQTAEQILAGPDDLESSQRALFSLLDVLSQTPLKKSVSS